jgi:hypothetical protein
VRRLVLLLALLASCSGPSSPTVPEGEWGGRNLELVVGNTGASGTFKCGAMGRIEQSLVLDSSGGFDVPGTFDPVLVAGGPHPARYSGMLSGSTLRVTVSSQGAAVGTFQLEQGRPAAFDVCNF